VVAKLRGRWAVVAAAAAAAAVAPSCGDTTSSEHSAIPVEGQISESGGTPPNGVALPPAPEGALPVGPTAAREPTARVELSIAPEPMPLPRLADCARLPRDAVGCLEDPRALCRHFVREMEPAAAAHAVDCLRRQPADSLCDPCDLRRCAIRALEALPPQADARCEAIGHRDPERGELCRQFVAGLNRRGRRRLTKCLAEGNGVRFCLWDPMVTPCYLVEDRDEPPFPPRP
jgi:hypothetical protein